MLAFFLLIIFVTLWGFAFSFYGAFNAEIVHFRDPWTAFGTLLYGILGDTLDYNELSQTNRYWATTLNWIFVAVCSILFFSLCLTMVDSAYDTVKAKVAQAKKFGDRDMIIDRLAVLGKKARRRAQHLVQKVDICRCCQCFYPRGRREQRISTNSSRRCACLVAHKAGESKKQSTEKKRGKGVWVQEWIKERKKFQDYRRQLTMQRGSRKSYSSLLRPKSSFSIVDKHDERLSNLTAHQLAARYATEMGNNDSIAPDNQFSTGRTSRGSPVHATQCQSPEEIIKTIQDLCKYLPAKQSVVGEFIKHIHSMRHVSDSPPLPSSNSIPVSSGAEGLPAGEESKSARNSAFMGEENPTDLVYLALQESP